VLVWRTMAGSMEHNKEVSGNKGTGTNKDRGVMEGGGVEAGVEETITRAEEVVATTEMEADPDTQVQVISWGNHLSHPATLWS